MTKIIFLDLIIFSKFSYRIQILILLVLACQDVSLASVSMRPIPFAPVLEKLSLTEENYGSVRRFYIETTEDNTVPLSNQQKMCESNPPEKVFRLKSSDHSPFFSKPQALHKLFVEIAKMPPLSNTQLGNVTSLSVVEICVQLWPNQEKNCKFVLQSFCNVSRVVGTTRNKLTIFNWSNLFFSFLLLTKCKWQSFNYNTVWFGSEMGVSFFLFVQLFAMGK